VFASRLPFINKINKKKIFESAKKYMNMPLDLKKEVLWSDESKFELFGQKRRSKVWQKTGSSQRSKYSKDYKTWRW